MAAGSTKPRAGTAERRQAFVRAYITNGHNATQAAIAAGFSSRSARMQGARMMTNDDVRRRIAELRDATAQAAELTITETIRELRAILINDPGLFLTDDGAVKPVSDWTPSMRSAIASLEVEERFEGHGKNREFVGYTKKLKFWDKGAAIDKAMRHLGLFERDNDQKQVNLNVQVLLVGPS
jgi:phage terminase small subunit